MQCFFHVIRQKRRQAKLITNELSLLQACSPILLTDSEDMERNQEDCFKINPFSDQENEVNNSFFTYDMISLLLFVFANINVR